jgi:hypothetical protein
LNRRKPNALATGVPAKDDVLVHHKSPKTSTRGSSRWFWISCLAAMFVSLAFISGDARAVILPLYAVLIVTAAFLEVSLRRQQTVPIDDLGAWYLTAGTVYAVLPLVLYLSLGMVFTPFNDSRLFAMQPPPSEVGRIAWMYVVHIAAFAFVYTLARGKVASTPKKVAYVPTRVVMITASLWIALSGSLLVLESWVPAATSYSGRYVAVASLPLVTRQILKLVTGASFVLSLVLLIVFFLDFRRWKYLIAMWLGYQLVVAVIAGGSRTSLVLAFASSVILYHVQVRPVRRRAAALLGTGALTAFLALGIARSLRSDDWFSDEVAPTAGEFESMFANAVDLDYKRASGEIPTLPTGWFLSDIVAPIPSQLLPFRKFDPSEWYVSSFYPQAKDEGQGFAFGVVSQGVLGYGWPDLVLRGLLLGLLFGWLHRFYRRNANRLWVTVFYVWMTVSAYQSFRSTALTFLPTLIQIFLPTMLLVKAFTAVFAGTRPLASKEARSRRVSGPNGVIGERASW